MFCQLFVCARDYPKSWLLSTASFDICCAFFFLSMFLFVNGCNLVSVRYVNSANEQNNIRICEKNLGHKRDPEVL